MAHILLHYLATCSVNAAPTVHARDTGHVCPYHPSHILKGELL